MKKYLFNPNIIPNCSYCKYSVKSGEGYICSEKKVIKHNKCRKFCYNPTLRVPVSERELPAYSKTDFIL